MMMIGILMLGFWLILSLDSVSSFSVMMLMMKMIVVIGFLMVKLEISILVFCVGFDC